MNIILGKTVFIWGGVRALERLSVQLCALWGCKVTCVAPTYTQEYLLSLGAFAVIGDDMVEINRLLATEKKYKLYFIIGLFFRLWRLVFPGLMLLWTPEDCYRRNFACLWRSLSLDAWYPLWFNHQDLKSKYFLTKLETISLGVQGHHLQIILSTNI